ncbi:hypothetical protein CHL78_006830 [Romboutsia weinsteinii]|uniref:Uncharacterized protein n=1 Tax=Romboutsia weinsteinii TaxID=2020949 RepID=A0A371J5F5_9FIRM|nr:hypothetical protein [Romboutsia weinsteinii]RDY28012.1 hypothetical protein CHL78_006830 [Romboutsia weinsteinii]
MSNLKKYNKFIDETIENSPDFMIIEENNERLLLFDRFVMAMSDKAMPWLFKVYLDKNYNIIRDDNFTEEMIHKYKDISLKIIDLNGNIFLNKNSMGVILNELEDCGQIIYDYESAKLELK